MLHRAADVPCLPEHTKQQASQKPTLPIQSCYVAACCFIRPHEHFVKLSGKSAAATMACVRMAAPQRQFAICSRHQRCEGVHLGSEACTVLQDCCPAAAL